MDNLTAKQNSNQAIGYSNENWSPTFKACRQRKRVPNIEVVEV